MTDSRNGNSQGEKMILQKEKYLKLRTLQKTIPLIIKKKKHLGINLTQEVQDAHIESYKTKETEDLIKSKNISCVWIGRFLQH